MHQLVPWWGDRKLQPGGFGLLQKHDILKGGLFSRLGIIFVSLQDIFTNTVVSEVTPPHSHFVLYIYSHTLNNLYNDTNVLARLCLSSLVWSHTLNECVMIRLPLQDYISPVWFGLVWLRPCKILFLQFGLAWFSLVWLRPCKIMFVQFGLVWFG